jgi:hypothetical protein
MKIIQIYTIITIAVLSSISATHASEQKTDSREMTQSHTTQHPPHDHQQTDHIKKLDESIRRKREDDEKSH